MKRTLLLFIASFLMAPLFTSAATLTGMPFVEIIGPNPDTVQVGQTYVDPGYIGSSGYAPNDWHHIVVISPVDTSVVGQTSRSYSIYGTSWLNPDGSIYHSGGVMVSTSRTINVTGQTIPPTDTSGDLTDDTTPPDNNPPTETPVETPAPSPVISSGASTMPYCSGPMAPGWNTSSPDGGCGGHSFASGSTLTLDNTTYYCPEWFPTGCFIRD